eukprot:CAMPEP_0195282704 /NCGR_PEP_ID=MMETSP0707-20130614/1486_1 /TAXON_ID=33640 /ORGANISM="Asterionellopsis glacialis, Strain CCMP134" /LENGTH=420 /DNA_ID=CAMNT_0040341729 /DNA_START=57 /DNA_END=1319 /DNA_ORIENTATION=+
MSPYNKKMMNDRQFWTWTSCAVVALLLPLITTTEASLFPSRGRSSSLVRLHRKPTTQQQHKDPTSWGLRVSKTEKETGDVSIQDESPCWGVMESLRAGAMTDESDDSDDEEEEEESSDYETSEDDEEYEDSEDEYDSAEESEEESVSEDESEDEATTELEVTNEDQDYDELLPLPSGLQMGATFGVMLAVRGVDLYQPKIVRAARFAFIAYLVITQIFLAYVRVKAKMVNDRTPIEISNPLSSVLQSQLGGGGGGGGKAAMAKDLASSFLQSKSTVYEYDMKQIKSTNSSLLFNMCFMWFLHFKMNQVQPLILQTVTGLMNLFYSPLFQAYVLGRHLKRPFKSAATAAMEQKLQGDKTGEDEEDTAEPMEAEEEEDDVEEEEEESDEEESDHDDDDDEEEEEDDDESDESDDDEDDDDDE